MNHCPCTCTCKFFTFTFDLDVVFIFGTLNYSKKNFTLLFIIHFLHPFFFFLLFYFSLSSIFLKLITSSFFSVFFLLTCFRIVGGVNSGKYSNHDTTSESQTETFQHQHTSVQPTERDLPCDKSALSSFSNS